MPIVQPTWWISTSLSCDQIHITRLWHECAQCLRLRIQKYYPTINHQLTKLLEHALIHWRSTPKSTTPAFLHTRFAPLFDAQSSIGWHHILKGRFPTLWLSSISPDEKFASRWLPYTIKHILNLWYNVWKYRCDTNQGDNPTNKDLRMRQRLLPLVKQLYDSINRVDPSDSYVQSEK
jgi:hypothetical protein